MIASLSTLEGDVAEIDGLNHYIGMRPLGEAATFERSIALIGIAALVLLILAAIFIHNKWVRPCLPCLLLLFQPSFWRSAILDGKLWSESKPVCTAFEQCQTLYPACSL